MTIRSLVGASTGIDESRFSILSANPGVYGADFVPIATATAGSGGASSISFSSIPSTYQHLQVRGVVLLNRTVPYTGPLYMSTRINGLTSGYAYHTLGGEGSAAFSDAQSGASSILTYSRSSTSNDSIFSPFIIDILDYAATSQNKTVRIFSGYDANGSGYVSLNSGLYASNDAVTSISILCNVNTGGTLYQYSTAALYGVKA